MTDAVPELVSVTTCAALVVLTLCAANVSEAGLKVTAGTPVPVPESETDWGLPTPLSVNTSIPVRLPVAEGVNVTETVHGVLGTIGAGQLLVKPKSPFVELILVMVKFVLPVLVTVMFCAALVVPTF